MSAHKSNRSKIRHTHYILDGYNIIHALPPLKAKLGIRKSELSRAELFTLASEISQATLSQATLFFDGFDAEDLVESGNVQVVYSGSRKADDCICEKAAKIKIAAKVCVVSADNAILAFCQAQDIPTLRPQKWLQLLPFPSEKPDYPNHAEMRFWEKVFDKKPINKGG